MATYKSNSIQTHEGGGNIYLKTPNFPEKLGGRIESPPPPTFKYFANEWGIMKLSEALRKWMNYYENNMNILKLDETILK